MSRAASQLRRGNRRSRRARPRRGAVLVVALVCLLISMSLLGSMLQGAIRSRRQLHAVRDQHQTEWLLKAGADRAAYRLSTEEEYRGETWNASLNGIAGRADAEVVIEASRESADEPWQVRVVAEFPLGSERSIRRSHTYTVLSPKIPTEE